MKRVCLILVLSVAWLSSTFVETAVAQGRPAIAKKTYVPYRPSRPTLSPWFDLYNTNRGPLPNYFNYVLPRQIAEQTFANQGAAIQQQQIEYRNLQNQVVNFEKAAAARPTGSSSGFQNYRQRFQNQGPYYQNR